MRCRCPTNAIENLTGIVRRTGRSVTHQCDADMALRWTAAGSIDDPKSLRKVQGIQHIRIFGATLGRPDRQAHAHLDEPKLAAQRARHRRRLQLRVGHHRASERSLTFRPRRTGPC
jgi:hypothetical protein